MARCSVRTCFEFEMSNLLKNLLFFYLRYYSTLYLPANPYTITAGLAASHCCCCFLLCCSCRSCPNLCSFILCRYFPQSFKFGHFGQRMKQHLPLSTAIKKITTCGQEKKDPRQIKELCTFAN